MAHIHDKIDFIVETFIVHNNKVLLRIHDKYKFWLSVGGHIELDEDPIQAAIREVKEEVGLDIEIYNDQKELDQFNEEDEKMVIRPQYINRHHINNTHEHIALIYFAKSSTDKLHPSETEISDHVKWFTSEELDNPKYNLRPKIKFYAKKALEKLSTIEIEGKTSGSTDQIPSTRDFA